MRKSILLLFDISNAADKIVTYTNQMTYLDFIDNDMAVDAAIRNYEVIPKQLRHDNPQIEWRQIKDFRDHLVHKYYQIDYEIIWKIKQEELGKLVDLIEMLLNTLVNSGKEDYYD